MRRYPYIALLLAIGSLAGRSTPVLAQAQAASGDSSSSAVVLPGMATEQPLRRSS